VEVQLNTLYVVTRKAVLRRDHLTVRVEVERKARLSVPIHQLEAINVFGGIHVTPWLMALCAERGVAVTFLTESGRLRPARG
jgi:CRISPR-associated protein Cas1